MLKLNSLILRYVLDTNTLIKVLSGELSIQNITEGFSVYFIVPGIVYMELLSKEMSADNLQSIQKYLNKFEVAEAGLHEYIVAADLRRTYKSLKTPDAIIAATAMTHQATLLTGDELLLKIKEVSVVKI